MVGNVDPKRAWFRGEQHAAAVLSPSPERSFIDTLLTIDNEDVTGLATISILGCYVPDHPVLLLFYLNALFTCTMTCTNNSLENATSNACVVELSTGFLQVWQTWYLFLGLVAACEIFDFRMHILKDSVQQLARL